MAQSNTKKDNNLTHISIRATKDTPNLKEQLSILAKKAGRRFNDYILRLLTKHIEDSKNEGN